MAGSGGDPFRRERLQFDLAGENDVAIRIKHEAVGLFDAGDFEPQQGSFGRLSAPSRTFRRRPYILDDAALADMNDEIVAPDSIFQAPRVAVEKDMGLQFCNMDGGDQSDAKMVDVILQALLVHAQI
jgi:hypothetical protein